MTLIWGEPAPASARTRVVALVYGFYYSVCIALLRPMIRVPDVVIPCSRLLYCGRHSDLIPGIVANRSFQHLYWINDDSAGGRASAMPSLRAKINVFRFSRNGQLRPFHQILRFLQDCDAPVGIFTDAGRRDGKVRPSLVALASRSGRRIVPIRVIPSRAGVVAGQLIPLPLSRIEIRVGEPIDVNDADDGERMLALVQARLDALGTN